MKKLADIFFLISLILLLLGLTGLGVATFSGGEEVGLTLNYGESSEDDAVSKVSLECENTGSKTLTDVTLYVYLPKDLRMTSASPSAETTFTKMVPGSRGSHFVLAVYDDDNNKQEASSIDQINDAVERAKKNEAVEAAFGEGVIAFLQRINIAFPIMIVLAVLLFILAFIYKGHGRTMMAILLIFCLILGGGGATVLSLLIGTRGDKVAVVEKTITIDKEDYKVYGVAHYHYKAIDDPFAFASITFETAPGTKIPQQKVKTGSTVMVPASPVREGYVCVGWYLDDTFTQKYDFAAPVKGNMTLYAKWANSFTGWDTDGDGIADSDEIRYGSDPEKADDTKSDTDKDGLIDYLEIHLYKTDINNRDTDGDKLTDGEEAFKTHTDPVIEDTNGNGTSDYDEDPDKDQLINGREIEEGTDPLFEDTDMDHFLDGREVERGTDPLNEDTDGDEALDGWEVEHGYDPTVIDQLFEVEVTPADEDDGIIINADFVGNPETINVEERNIEGLLDNNIPGCMSDPYRLDYQGQMNAVVITFPVEDPTGEAEPIIYAYDEDTQLLTELPTKVTGGEAITELEEIDIEKYENIEIESQNTRKTVTFILLNKLLLDEVWNTRIVPPDGNAYNDSVFEMVFVIDYSSSMDTNDPDYLRLDIVCEFIDKLRPDHDLGSVVKFAAAATTLLPLTTDLEALKNTTKGITNADSGGCSSEDGTDGSAGIYEGIQQLKDTESDYRYIIFLTDGRDNAYAHDYNDLINEAKENEIIIYCIGMGNADEVQLTNIAESTGGEYYYASAVEGEDITAMGLDEAFYEIGVSTVDLTSDSNEDGISDYYTKLMCDGTLRSGTGTCLFEGIALEDVQANDDYDQDGIKNGDEVKIHYDEKTQRTYMIVISSPVSGDSDDDGVPDNEDTAPLTKGLAGGVYGVLRLISCYNTDDAGWTSGHAFFIYTSYIKDTLDFSGLAAGWQRADTSKPWSFDNLHRDDVTTSAYEMQPGESVAIGNGALGATLAEYFGSGEPTSDANGVDYNIEVYKHFHPDIGYDYLHNTYVEETITGTQLATLLAYVSQDSVSYWSAFHNCAEVAAQAWNYIAYTYVSPYDDDFFLGGIATPKGMTRNMRKLEGGCYDDFWLGNEFN